MAVVARVPPRRVEVWWAPAKGSAAWAARLLSIDERRRAVRMPIAAAEKFIRSRGFVRGVLSRYTDTAPSELIFSRRCLHCGDQNHGRPFLADRELEFSLSRTDGMAVVAVADSPVGVDVEHRAGLRDPDSVARMTLSRSELADCDDCPETRRVSHVLSAWTRKEAYLKGVGVGLATDPREVEFGEPGIEGWQPVRDRSNRCRDAWWLRPLDSGPDFLAALAVSARPHEVRQFEFDAASRMNHESLLRE